MVSYITAYREGGGTSGKNKENKKKTKKHIKTGVGGCDRDWWGGGHVRERFPSPTAAEKQSASGAIDFAFRVLRICSIVIVYMHMDMEIIIVA